MTIDDRARAASAAVHDGLAGVGIPDAKAVVRRAARRRRMTAAAAALVVLAGVGVGLAAAAHDPAAEVPAEPRPATTGGWARVDKADAGLEPGSHPNAIDSDGITAVMVGLVPGDGVDGLWDAALWWSGDGVQWHRTEAPDVDAMPTDVAIVGQDALATGVVLTSTTGPGTPFLWRSDDAGRTWHVADDVEGLDGVTLDDLRHVASHWIGVGRGPAGENGVWVSRAGHSWESVISTPADEPVIVRDGGDGSIRAITATQAWTTTDPTNWGEPAPFSLPATVSPADGLEIAIQRGPGPGPGGSFVVSDDGGRSWQVDRDFVDRFPDAQPTDVARLRSGYLVMGFDADSSPGAWVSADRHTWVPIPSGLRPPGGLLALAAEVDDRMIVFGTAPELEAFYTYDPPDIDGPVVPRVPSLDRNPPAGTIDPADEQAVADQLADATPGSMEWFRLRTGIQDFDPARATVGVSTLGQVAPFLDPLVAQNIPTLDPADYGVATTDGIPVAIGVYRGEPGQFDGWDGLMIATTVQPNGPESRSSTSTSRFDGIDAVLSAP
jgi:hypothetical protein